MVDNELMDSLGSDQGGLELGPPTSDFSVFGPGLIAEAPRISEPPKDLFAGMVLRGEALGDVFYLEEDLGELGFDLPISPVDGTDVDDILDYL